MTTTKQDPENIQVDQQNRPDMKVADVADGKNVDDEQLRYSDIGADFNAQKRVPTRGKGRASMIICNHTGFLEILGIRFFNHHLNFAPKADYKKTPILGTILVGMGSFFIDRGDGTDKDYMVKKIMKRQRAIE